MLLVQACYHWFGLRQRSTDSFGILLPNISLSSDIFSHFTFQVYGTLALGLSHLRIQVRQAYGPLVHLGRTASYALQSRVICQ